MVRLLAAVASLAILGAVTSALHAEDAPAASPVAATAAAPAPTPGPFAKATVAAQALEGIFEAAFKAPTGKWQNVELEYCDPISDTAMTVAMSESLKQWRLEYLSMQDEPPDSMLAQY